MPLIHFAVLRNFTNILSWTLFCSAFAVTLSANQLPQAARSQINRQSAMNAEEPAKIRLKPSADAARVGTKSQVSIELLNAEGQPVPARNDWACEVSFRLPSGDPKSQTVWIKEGQSAAEFDFVPEAAGLTSIFVKPPVPSVRPDKAEVIVQPGKDVRKSRRRPATSSSSPAAQRLETPNDLSPSARAHFLDASYPLASPSLAAGGAPTGPGIVPNPAPVLHLSVNDVGNNFFANGKDAAIISAVFESADFKPAPADIHIWLHWTNGSLDPPPPLVIPKGTFSGKTQLLSVSPADVHVNFVSSNPPYQAQGDTDFTVHFVPSGVALIGPDSLSVVDNAQIMLVFYDAQNNPVSPGRDWPVTLRCRQSKFHFTPSAFKVAAASPMGSAVLLPTSVGSDTIEAVVANYNPAPLPIVVTGWLVLGLCLGGGVAGGLAAYDKFKGSWFWRIFLGILGGLMLCWLYVYLALPSIDNSIAHNTFSVFFVALLGGYLGITVLDFAAKKLGLA